LSRSTRFNRRRATDGFTLIEVVVALAVIAVVLTAIGSLIAASVRGARALDHHLTLVETARAIEAGLPDRADLKPGTLAGEVSGQRWRVDVRPLPAVEVETKPTPWIPQSVVITVQSPGGSILQVNLCACVRGQRMNQAMSPASAQDQPPPRPGQKVYCRLALIETLIATALMIAGPRGAGDRDGAVAAELEPRHEGRRDLAFRRIVASQRGGHPAHYLWAAVRGHRAFRHLRADGDRRTLRAA
jgi:general secretion pathway protein I